MVTEVLSVDCELISEFVALLLLLLLMTEAAAAAAVTAAAMLFGNVMAFTLFRSTSSSFLSMPNDENELQTVRISRIL